MFESVRAGDSVLLVWADLGPSPDMFQAAVRVEYSSKGVLKSPSLFSPLQPNVSEPTAPIQRVTWPAANSAFGNNLGDLYVTLV